MQFETIDKPYKEIIISYNHDERKVYFNALKKFRHGETYQKTPEPLRTSLQYDYARFKVDCFKRELRSRRRDASIFRKLY